MCRLVPEFRLFRTICFIITVLLIFTPLRSINAQSCHSNPAGLIELHTQAEVDNFQIDYGPCDTVGNLLIEGPDIANLDGLSDLTTIGTFLRINNNPNLVSLQALSSLSSVSRLELKGNLSLTNIDGLSSFTSRLSLSIEENLVLVNIDGLAGLTGVEESIIIGKNPALGQLNGLVNVAWVGIVVSIFENPSLLDLDGLSSLTSLGAEAEFLSDAGLQVIGNDLLHDVDGLSKIKTFHGLLWISGNSQLNSLHGLSGIANVYGLDISNNASLIDLNGLSVSGTVEDVLAIKDNPLLTNLDSLSRISSVGPSGVFIEGNASLDNLNGLYKLREIGGNLWIQSNSELSNIQGLSGLISVGADFQLTNNQSLANCGGVLHLVDDVDDAQPGPGPLPPHEAPDIGGAFQLTDNAPGCNSRQEVLEASQGFYINSGLNDAWFNPATSGQGFFVTVFPEIRKVFLAWFTFDTARPAENTPTVVGDAGHRWLTAFGAFEDNQASLDIEFTQGGIFDATAPAPEQEIYGTVILEFTSCNSGTVIFDISAVELSGVVPIQRIALDNVARCEAAILD